MEWLSPLSDLVGLIGGLLLAIPAVFSQPVRDQRDTLNQSIAGDDRVRDAMDAATRTYDTVIIRLSRRDRVCAVWGTCLLALAFLLKLVAEIVALTSR